tara:strand:+ start:170 stop:433 length:264 start_codon:yes stop_codon:yes gene_type:complete
MPKYFYKCLGCETVSEFYHSMNEIKEDCTACNLNGVLRKIPSKISSLNIIEGNRKVGSIVKQSIETFREDLEDEKQKLKNGFYGTDE